MIFESFIIILILIISLYLIGGVKSIPIFIMAAGLLSASLGMALFTDGITVADNIRVVRNSLDSNSIKDLNVTYTTYIGSFDSVPGKTSDSGYFILGLILLPTGILAFFTSVIPVARGKIFG